MGLTVRAQLLSEPRVTWTYYEDVLKGAQSHPSVLPPATVASSGLRKAEEASAPSFPLLRLLPHRKEELPLDASNYPPSVQLDKSESPDLPESVSGF